MLHVVVLQVGPGLVYLQFNHSFLGRGVMMHCVTPVEPLLQCVTHTMFYQANIPQVIPNFILKVESIQVRHLVAHVTQPFHCIIAKSALTLNRCLVLFVALL